jgi:hypothetical protein
MVYLKSPSSGAFAVLDGHGMDGDKVSSYVLEILKGIYYKIKKNTKKELVQ